MSSRVRFYQDDSEIIPEPGAMYILCGMGNKKMIQSAYAKTYGADVAIPVSVASGEMTPYEYVRGMIENAKSKSLKPIVVFTIDPYPSYINLSETELENIGKFDDADEKYIIYSYSTSAAFAVYVQAPAFFRVTTEKAINRYEKMYPEDDGLVVELGNGNFQPEYFVEWDELLTREYDKYDDPRPISSTIKLVEHVIRLLPMSKAVILVAMMKKTKLKKGGAFDMPNDDILGTVILGLSSAARSVPFRFLAVFVVGDDPEMVKKVENLKETYKPRITAVFERSIAIQDLSETVVERERESWKMLRGFFPSFTFNMVDNTFTSKDDGRTRSRPITELMSPRLTKNFDADDKRDIVNAVNYIQNKRRDRKEKATTRTEDALSMFSNSLYKFFEEMPEEADEAVKKVVGKYPLDARHDIVITNDPVAVFAKSTGQDWEKESCEKDGGSHSEGPYSDIENGNCVAFIFDKDTSRPIARMMLRWCEDDDGKIGFGIEARWYYTTIPGKGTKSSFVERQNIYPGMTSLNATTALVKILDEKGVYDYDHCETPYKYAGYSDLMQTSNTKIQYGNLKKNKAVKQVLTEGTFDISKKSLKEIIDLVDDGIVSLRDKDNPDKYIITTKIVEDPDSDDAVQITQEIFRYFSFSTHVDLVTALAESRGRAYHVMLEKMLLKLRSDLSSIDGRAMIEMATSYYFSKHPRAIVMILSNLVGEKEKVSMPARFSASDDPHVLMAAAPFYHAGGRLDLFEATVKKLAMLFDPTMMMEKIQDESSEIRQKLKKNEFPCRSGWERIGKYTFCESSASEFFITLSDEDGENHSGIKTIYDPMSIGIPRGFDGTEENNDPIFTTLIKPAAKEMRRILDAVSSEKSWTYP